MNPYQYHPPNSPYGQPPPQGYPQPARPTAEDEANLNTLAICHYIYAGLVGLFGLFGLIYVVVGFVIAAGTFGPGTSGGGPPPAALGGIFAAIGGAFTLVLWGMSACLIYSGVSLRKRRRRTFSLVMACICCMNVPLGTALGVFTLVVLSRQSVKSLYDGASYYGT